MKRGVRVVLLLAGGILALVFLRAMMGRYGNDGERAPRAHLPAFPETLGGTPSGNPQADSLAVALTPRATGLDTGYVVDVTITNRGGSAVRNVVLTCDALSGSGETTGHTSVTVSGVFPPHGTTTTPGVALRFIHRPEAARCTIADFAVVR